VHKAGAQRRQNSTGVDIEQHQTQDIFESIDRMLVTCKNTLGRIAKECDGKNVYLLWLLQTED